MNRWSQFLLVFVFHSLVWSEGGPSALYYQSVKYSDSELSSYCWGVWGGEKGKKDYWVSAEARGLTMVSDSLRRPEFIGGELLIREDLSNVERTEVYLEVLWKNTLTGDVLGQAQKKDVFVWKTKATQQKNQVLQQIPWDSSNLILKSSPYPKWCQDAYVWLGKEKRKVFQIQ